MRHSSRLAQSSSSSSSAAVLGKGMLNVASSSSLKSGGGGPYAAMLFMQRFRVGTSGAYLSEGTSRRVIYSSSVRRRRRYEPYSWILQRYIERGSVDIDMLLYHPDAPSPVEVLLGVMRHRTPCQRLTTHALEAVLTQPRLTSSAGAASFALQTLSNVLRQRCPHLYNTPTLRVLLCQALLFDRLFGDAMELLEGMPDAWITPGLWMTVMEAAAEGKIPHSPLLWRLLTLAPRNTPHASRIVRTGHCVFAELPRNEASAKSEEFMGRSAERVDVNNSNGNVDSNFSEVGDSDMVTFSPFEVRPASVVRLVHDTQRSEWCHLGTAEVGYAEKHYKALRDERAWGQGTLYVDSDHTSEGIVYGVDARLASRLMLRGNVSFSGQASPLIALHVLRRYLRTCHVLKEQAVLLNTTSAVSSVRTETSSSTAVTKKKKARGAELKGVQVHPSPFLMFFKIIREARDVVAGGADYTVVLGQSHIATTGGLPMIHWGVVWRFFQTLNRECPLWYNIIPDEAADLCQYVIDCLCRGANPWMSLNVARAVSSRHIVDGLVMSLWLLHRLDVSHHTMEAREVTKKVFQWLLVDVGVHLLPRLHHHLIPASRVLIRLGLHQELKQFYNAVLDNAYVFSEGFRADFMRVMEDLVCPMCSSILSEQDVYIERSCSLCMTVVPPKDISLLPSFQLSNEHVAHLREKRKALRLRERRRLYERIYHWSKGDGNRGEEVALLHGTDTGSWSSGRSPLDASAVFKNEILGDTVPLIPGVSVNADMPLFPLEDKKEADSTNVPFDIHAAMEESSRRLQLQEASRQYTLAQRGVSLSSARLFAAPPSLLSSDLFQTISQQHQKGKSEHLSKLLTHIRVEGPWTCVWCQEQNLEWSSRVQCAACGAETGPSAPWRHFAYAESGDVMAEIRARVANAEERPVDAVVAAYMLMVFRRAFILRATPHDYERVDQLIRRLCLLHERVLAGYLYVRFVSQRSRCKNETLFAVAKLFGCSEMSYAELTPHDLIHNEEKFFQTIFTPDTCRVCFGSHAWKTCPIITRDFSTSTRASITMTAEEKQRVMLQKLRLAVEAAVQHGAENSRLVVDAYTTFVKSPFRELFAEVHSREVNRLSILLSQYHQYRRAAFVLCHIPLHLRDNLAYLVMTHYFNVPADEARELLQKRSPLGVEDESHPNFVQVALTCCMCLDERHASFECPRLMQWLSEVDAHCAVVNTSSLSSTTTASALYNLQQEEKRARRLRAQVDGWTSAGPERLHAFYRFLLQRVDVFQEDMHGISNSNDITDNISTVSIEMAVVTRKPKRRINMDDIIVYAMNKTIAKLAAVGHEKGACRLYARAPLPFISRHTTLAMLRMHRFSEEGIRTLLSNNKDNTLSSSSLEFDNMTVLGSSSEAARTAAVPMQGRCLLCFETGHAYMDCPELTAQPTTAAKLEYVVVQVGGIRCSFDGVRAAAAYVYHMYNLGNFSGEMLRANPSLVRSLLCLVRRCFATGQLAAGTRVLRRIPTEMVPPARVYTDLWRAAGMEEEAISDRCAQLVAIYEAEGLVPSIDNPPSRQTYSNRFVTNLSRALHDDLCRHCYQHGHTLATCSVFHAEVSFGRDYVAAYRMSMMSEQLDQDWQDAYLLKLTDFFQSHRLFMPYHIVGVTNALNAIAAMWSFRGEPGIAMRHLLNIPPAYRRRQAFRHILHALQVSSVEMNNVLANVYFSPDELVSSSPSLNKRQDNLSASLSVSSSLVASHSSGAVAQHLLMPRPAIRDVAMSAVFNHFPAALEVLEKSEERMAIIRRRNATQKVTSDTVSKSAGTTTTTTVTSKKLTMEPSQNTSLSFASSSAALHVMQSGDILTLREDFDPVLTELEVAVGMKLGSRHVLFTSAVDILAAVANKMDDNSRENQVPSTSTSISSPKTTVLSEASGTKKMEVSNALHGQKPSDEGEVINVFAEEARRDDVESKRGQPRNLRENKATNIRTSQSSVSSSTEKRSTFSNASFRHQQGRRHKQQQQHSQRPRFQEKRQQQKQENNKGLKGDVGNLSPRLS